MTNPVLSEKALQSNIVIDGEPMTVSGAINKAFFLFLCVVATSIYEFYLYLQGFADKAQMLLIGGFIASIIAFITIMVARKTIKYMAPIYALSQGLVLGGISVMFEQSYPGIVIQAISASFMAFFVMLSLYKIGVIKCTERFRSVLFISTLSIAGLYLIEIIGSFFGYHIPQIFTSSAIGIGFSAIVVTIAALNFIIDFDFIERGAAGMLDKNFEWYGAFGLMVTFIWLYMEMLRLLAKLRDR